jgi:hypothetical protein
MRPRSTTRRLLVSQGHHRIDPGGAARWHVGRHDGNTGENHSDRYHRQWIACADTEQKARHQACQPDRPGHSDDQPQEGEPYAAVQDQTQQASSVAPSAERMPISRVLCATLQESTSLSKDDIRRTLPIGFACWTWLRANWFAGWEVLRALRPVVHRRLQGTWTPFAS